MGKVAQMSGYLVGFVGVAGGENSKTYNVDTHIILVTVSLTAYCDKTSDRLTLADWHRGPCSISTYGCGMPVFGFISFVTFCPNYLSFLIPTI